MTHRLAIAALLAAGTVTHADVVRPARVPAKARELADTGRKHHSAGNYEAAVSAFKEAYVLAPSSGLLFNIAQAHRLAGNCDEAAWMYRRYLDTGPRGPHRTLAETHLGAVEKCGTGGLRVSVTPLQLDARVPAPVAESGMAPRRSTPTRRGTGLQRAGTYTLIGGGAALAGAAVFALDARDAAQTVEDTYRRGGRWETIASTDARGERSATLARVLVVGGAASALTGAILYGLGRHHERTRQVSVTPAPGGAQVRVSWGF